MGIRKDRCLLRAKSSDECVWGAHVMPQIACFGINLAHACLFPVDHIRRTVQCAPGIPMTLGAAFPIVIP